MGERGSVLRENEELSAKAGRLEEEERGLRETVAGLRARLKEEAAGSDAASRGLLEREVQSLRDQLELSAAAAENLRRELTEERTRAHRADQDLLALRRMNDTLRRQREEAQAALASQLHCDLEDVNGNGNGSGNGAGIPSPSRSRDSAIDADLCEWEVEQVEMPVEEEELGLELGGGRDEPVPGSCMPIYVKAVDKAGRLYGKLRRWDEVLEVNEMEVGGMAHETVVDILRHARPQLQIKVRRRKFLGGRVTTYNLGPEARDGRHGLILQDAVVVAGLRASSPAARLAASLGDRLLHINSVPVEGRTAQQVGELLRVLGQKDPRGLTITVLSSGGGSNATTGSISRSITFPSPPSTDLPTPMSTRQAPSSMR